MRTPRHSADPAPGPPFVAALLVLTSTVLVVWLVWQGCALLPDARFGALEARGRATLAAASGGAWLVAVGVLTSRLLRGGRPERQGGAYVRFGFASVLVAGLLAASLATYDGTRVLWRGRAAWGAYLLAASAIGGLLLLWPEIGRLRDRSRSRGGGRAFLLVLASSTALVFIGEGLLDLWMFLELRYVPDHARAEVLLGNLALNVGLLSVFLGSAWALTNRFACSFLGCAALYLHLIALHALKLRSLDEPLRVLDGLYLSELGALRPGLLTEPWFLGWAATGALFLMALVLMLRGGRKEDPGRASGSWGLNAFARFGLLGLSVALGCGYFWFLRLDDTTQRRWLPWLAGSSDRIGQETAAIDPVQASLRDGFLWHLAQDGAAARVQRPPGAARERIRALLQLSESGGVQPGVDRPPNLVLVLVDSFLDTARLDARFTEDPLPFFHRLRSERPERSLIVPNFGVPSPNTEFELLTGLSMAFLPRGAIPYRQWIGRDLPALPRLLRDHGYRTHAVLTDGPALFDRALVLPRLGFESTRFLDADPGVARDATGRWVSDEAVVDAVLELVSEERPFFALASMNATRGPYERALYPPLGIDVLEPTSAGIRRQLGGYANALRALDRALERLVGELDAAGEPTVVVIVGDHLPAFAGAPLFSGTKGVFATTGFFDAPKSTARRRRFEVPLVTWDNLGRAAFPRESATSGASEVAAPFLGLELVEHLGVEPGPLQRVVASLAEDARSGAASGEGLSGLGLSTAARRDYRHVQYDVLFESPPLVDWFSRARQ